MCVNGRSDVPRGLKVVDQHLSGTKGSSLLPFKLPKRVPFFTWASWAAKETVVHGVSSVNGVNVVAGR
jgi:hypothetical protein